MVIIRLNAGNDKNGNPRRLYVHLDDSGSIVKVYDEGYRGWGAVPEELQRAASRATTFMTTPSEYRELKKQYGGK